MSRPLLPATVVIPTLNAGATIEDCLRSLLALRYPRELREIVVVDNGSRDGTRAVLERYDDEIVVVEETRRGRSAARNAGVRRARGDVVAFTDADCTVDPDWLRELVQPLRDDAVGIVGGRILASDDANDAALFGETIHDQRAAILVWRPAYVSTGSWASRRAVLEDAGLFDERLARCEDVDLSYRVGRAGFALVYRPEAVVYHRNERSVLGLCREGWAHGFHSVRVLARHAEYVAEARRRTSSDGASPSSRRLPARYGVAFRSGKRLGQVAGRAWVRLGSGPVGKGP